MKCLHCRSTPSDPSLPRNWVHVCRACYRSYYRKYMRNRRQSTRVSWQGTPAHGYLKIQRQVTAEARERGVPVETIIREWGLRAHA